MNAFSLPGETLHLELAARLDGRLVLTNRLPLDAHLTAADLYKFIWVDSGSVVAEVDRIPVRLDAGDALALSPLQRMCFIETEGACRALCFNSNFYCIFGHDDEVSCNGLLFNGSSHLVRMHLSDAELAALDRMTGDFASEYAVDDRFREEMLRIQLKRFIIFFTRLAHSRFDPSCGKDPGFEIVRRFYVLVDTHFREKRRVADYASMLCRSPKTLTNLFARYGLPSPRSVIRDRQLAEARRLTLYTNRSAKEIALTLGFADPAAFSRFFRQAGGESITLFRSRYGQNGQAEG